MALNRQFSTEDRNLEKSTVLIATKNREYLDLDMSLSVIPVSGDIYKKRNANAVKQAVINLLMTNQGEKPFMPYYGGNLNSFLFELAEIGAEQDIIDTVRENIRVYEPRVDSETLDVTVDLQPEKNSIEITVKFRVINTNETVEFTTRLNRLR
jgi:phage baseplate assembly protein W